MALLSFVIQPANRIAIPRFQPTGAGAEDVLAGKRVS